MAVDRPTFDESWHRVANLRPRLRSVVQTHRQPYRDGVWHVYRDPGNNQYFRLSQPAHFLVGLLDGRRTVSEAWAIATDRLGDDAPTQGETIQALGMLYTSNLLHGELPPDAAGLLERYRKRKQRELRGYLTNLLFARIPLFDPDRLLSALTPVLGWVFGPVGLVLWLALGAAGLAAVAGRERELWNAGSGVLAPQNLAYLYLAFAGLKAIHELGHGIACKAMARAERSDGAVHELGIMLLVLIPMPYINTTSSWSFRSRWRRIVVSAAGMYVELGCAAAAALLWARTAEGTVTHALAYNVMFVASVTTILFNANPLIRFDGYYILSDLFEVPNLYQRSQNYLKYLVKRYAYGVRRPMNPAHRAGERVGFVTYGIASLVYRVLLFAGIFLMVADQLFFIGALLALSGVVGYVLVPLGKWVHYLASGPELVRTRVRAAAVTIGALAAAGLGLGAAPWPDHGRAPGVVEPRDLAVISLGESGFVEEVLPTGTMVRPGAGPLTLVRARHEELSAERRVLAAWTRELRVRQQMAMAANETARAQMLAEQLDAVAQQLGQMDRRISALSAEAPVAGRWVVAGADRLTGTWQQRGTPIGLVASMDDLVVRLTADQYLGPRLQGEIEPGDPVELRVPGRPDLTFTGRLESVLPAGSRELPAASLGFTAGGAVATDPTDRDGRLASERFFEVRIAVDPAGAAGVRLLPGQRVEARFRLPDRPLLSQAYLALRQLLQSRFQI